MANENSKAPAISQIIPLAKIHDLPGIPLSKLPDKTYGGLVTSIQAGGVKEPVILRLREDGEYQLVTGYRRRRASELAKKVDIPALVYQMTLPEAIAYHHGVQRQGDLPVPGKLVEAQGKEVKAPPVGDTPKEAIGTKEDAAPTDVAKDAKAQTTEPKTPDKAPAPATGDKPKEAASTKETSAPADAAKDTKDQASALKASAPAAGDKSKETAETKAALAPVGAAREQTTVPKVADKASAPVVDDKPKEAAGTKEDAAPADVTKDAKDQPTDPKATDKPPAPATGDKSKEATGTKETLTPAEPAKDTKDQAATLKASAPAAGDKSKEAADTKAAPALVGAVKDTKDQAATPKVPDKVPAPVTGDKPKETTVNANLKL